MRPISLSEPQARWVLGRVSGSGALDTELVHRHNYVWQLRCDAGTFFLKVYTKPWYAAHGPAHAFPVTHEAGRVAVPRGAWPRDA